MMLMMFNDSGRERKLSYLWLEKRCYRGCGAICQRGSGADQPHARSTAKTANGWNGRHLLFCVKTLSPDDLCPCGFHAV